MIGRFASALTLALLSVSTVHAGLFDPPDPNAFARAEDQERARFLMKPCGEADVGRGCLRHEGRLMREAPCDTGNDASAYEPLPTDQCFKMEPARRYRGIWIDEFENQQFIPENAKAPEWPRRGDPKTSKWKMDAERAIAATIWLDVERVKLGSKWRADGRKAFIAFVGRKTMYRGNYGHMGVAGHEIIVDHVLSLRECPAEGDCG